VKIFHTIDQLCQGTYGVVQIYPDEPSAYVLNKARLWADNIIDALIQTALFAESEEVKSFTRWLIRETGKQIGNFPASLHPLYQTLADDSENVSHQYVIPSIDISGMTYEMARAVYRARQRTDTGPVIFELNDSDQMADATPLSDYTVSVIAAAIKEQHAENGWGPIFLKRNLKVNIDRSSEELEGKLRELTDTIDRTLDAGIYNISIDASVPDGDDNTVEPDPTENARITAELVRYIRSKEPKNTPVTVSGTLTISENLTIAPKQLRTFLQEFQQQISSEEAEKDVRGIATVSIRRSNNSADNSGSDGKLVWSDSNKDMLTNLSNIAREEFALFGIVPRDIPQLSEQSLSDLSDENVTELQYSRDFQNFILNHPRFPRHLGKQIQTSSQEKNGVSLKKHLWEIEPHLLGIIMRDLEEEFVTLFDRLGIHHTSKLLRSYFQPAD